MLSLNHFWASFNRARLQPIINQADWATQQLSNLGRVRDPVNVQLLNFVTQICHLAHTVSFWLVNASVSSVKLMLNGV
jgi:hypothetical protein